MTILAILLSAIFVSSCLCVRQRLRTAGKKSAPKAGALPPDQHIVNRIQFLLLFARLMDLTAEICLTALKNFPLTASLVTALKKMRTILLTGEHSFFLLFSHLIALFCKKPPTPCKIICIFALKNFSADSCTFDGRVLY